MTTTAITDEQATQLFTTIRDSGFTFKIADLPELMTALGWTMVEQIPGHGAIAGTAWDVPDADVEMLYRDDDVPELVIAVTGPNVKDEHDRDVLQDTFVRLTELGTSILGQPTNTIKGGNPRIQWRGESSTVTLQRASVAVLISWLVNAQQDSADAAGRY